jgi:calcium/calmodulin-dependent protein kinase I
MGNRLFHLCPTDFYDEDGFDEKYEVDEGNAIGSGKFSTVHLCWKRNSPETRYALKCLDTGADDIAGIARIQEEIEILQLLGNHPGIISLVDVDESLTTSIRIVMELCEGGELYDAIQEKKFYVEPDAKLTIRNLLEAVAYIHSKGIMHRDLKPENILLVSKEEYTEVKISDFGLAKISRDYPRGLPRSHSICGSDFYLAPEIIKQEEYGREIDIWAVGVITYVLLSGSLPFFHQVLHKLYRQIVERDVSFPEEAWKNVSKGALDFILRLLQVRASDRLSADQSLNHPWLRGNSSGSSFGGSFQEIANFVRSNSNTTSTSNSVNPVRVASGADLNKVLSKCTSNAHPLEHARKVDEAKAAAAPASMAPVMQTSQAVMRPAGLVVQPQNSYMVSRGAQPMYVR